MSKTRTLSNATSFLDGGGMTGARLRAVDWSATPLGEPGQWPRSLKTVVRIVLDSRYAMWFAWGPALTFFCNDAYAPTLGLKQDWAIGAPASRVWAEIWPDIGPRIDGVLATGVATWDERLRLMLERSGMREETYHTFSYSPLPDDSGHVRGMLCVVTEDTDRVLGERRTALLAELASALAPIDSEAGMFQALSRCLGDAREDLPFTLAYLRHADGPWFEAGRSGGADAAAHDEAVSPRDWPLAQVADGDETVTVERAAVFGRLPRGPWDRACERAMLLPIASPGHATPAGVLVAGINPYRPLDDGYRRFLGLAVGQVAAALASARAWESGRRRTEELAELDRAKTTFFSNVSHELRTPLTLMIAPTEGALARPDGALAGDELRLVHRNQRRLLRLVNSLLDFARIEAGRMQPSLEPVDLATETAQVASVFRSAIERSGVRFVVDCTPLSGPVAVDRDMWEKIVLNLLSNAFKYTLAGEIRLSLSEVDGKAMLRVRDTGIGVPAVEVPRLFERFHRVQGAPGRTVEGTGIGLALVRELAILHGGEVDVASVPGEGSVFSVAIPMAGAAAGAVRTNGREDGVSELQRSLLDEATRWSTSADAPADLPGARAGEVLDDAAPAAPGRYRSTATIPPSTAGASDRDAHVLVVDDNSDMRDYLARLLGARWRVTTARDGMEALDIARRDRPDLVLTDTMMPRLDGIGLLAALRADPRTAATLVVLLSARVGEEARLDGLRGGADDYLVKPFGARELVARLDALLTLAAARREAMRREEALRAETRSVLETIHEGYLLLAADGRILQVNAAMEAICGKPRSELVGRAFLAALGSAGESRLEAMLRQSLEDRTPQVVEYHPADGDRWFEVAAYPDPRGLVVYARDISERKRAMLALQEADRRKDEFLATLAHELRNPLAPIRSAAEILASPRVGESERVRTRNVIRRQTRHMSRLLDDLLDVSRITRGRLELKREPTPIGAIVDTAVEAARALMPGRLDGLQVNVADRARIVDVDPVRLAQILTNLLNNAAKYTDVSGVVSLTVTLSAEEVLLYVRDSGIGMTAGQIAQAFELFSQFPAIPHRGDGGLGIGLALVRGIVALHGGSVTARSEGPGRGSEFAVRLPLAAAASSTVSAIPRAHANDEESVRRVLVVDDNADAALMLATFLEMSGHQTSVVHTGHDAVAAAARFNPDVLLLDIGLPDINGYEVARKVRAMPAVASVTLVAVTGWGQADDLQRAREAGFDFHLVKPADPEALLRLLAATPRRLTPERTGGPHV
jgi:PAS domain S-box-containing protein